MDTLASVSQYFSKPLMVYWLCEQYLLSVLCMIIADGSSSVNFLTLISLTLYVLKD